MEAPIVFDAAMNEYHIKNVGKDRHGHSVIYHCPFCGGAAPRSKRGSFFATITSAEARRLNELASSLRTVEEAIARLGNPDGDLEQGISMQTPASETQPAKVVSYRTLTYKHLSKTADVVLVDYGPERGVRVTLRGKYLGKPNA